jgi:hypothetical protein
MESWHFVDHDHRRPAAAPPDRQGPTGRVGEVEPLIVLQGVDVGHAILVQGAAFHERMRVTRLGC